MSGDERAGFLARPPLPALRPWVSALWYVAEPDAVGTELVLPSLGDQILVALGGDGLSARDPHRPDVVRRAPATALATSAHQSSLLDRREQRLIAGVVIRPGATPALTGVPGTASAEVMLDLSDLWGPGASELAERCHERADRPAEVLHHLEAVLLGRLQSAAEPDRALRRSMGALAHGAPVGRAGSSNGFSASSLQRRFRHDVGLSPKRFQRLVRLGRSLRRLAAGRDDLSTVAHRLGFHDQAHFTRDFRELTGLTPAAYRRSGSGGLHVPLEKATATSV